MTATRYSQKTGIRHIFACNMLRPIILMPQLSLEVICLSFCRDTALEILALRQQGGGFLPCLTTKILRIYSSRFNWNINNTSRKNIVPPLRLFACCRRNRAYFSAHPAPCQFLKFGKESKNLFTKRRFYIIIRRAGVRRGAAPARRFRCMRHTHF